MPPGVSVIVAITRTIDHVHHFSDINAGLFLGFAAGLIGYLSCYPSPLDLNGSSPTRRQLSSPFKLTTRVIDTAPGVSARDYESGPGGAQRYAAEGSEGVELDLVNVVRPGMARLGDGPS